MVPSGWKNGLFKDGIDLISGQHIDANLVNTTGIGNPYLTGPADFPDGRIIVTKYTTEGKKFSQKGDLLITVKGSGTGKVIESDNNYAISRQLMAIRPIGFDSRFTFYNLVASVSRYENAAAGLIPGISREDVLETPILIPPLPEQRKIAKILSTWDKAIAITERLIATSQQQKKALMQQLLTGKKRLVNPDTGKVFEGDWIAQPLKNIGKLQAGKFVNASDISNVKNEDSYPCYGGNGLRGFTTSYTHEGVYSLIGRQGALCGNITLAAGKFHATEHAVVVTPHKNIETKWLYYKLIESDLNQYATGQAQPGLSVKNLDPIEVLVAPIKEQQKIASVLTAADKEIERLEVKLAHLKEEKKALMQQLLTGKKRVKLDEMVAAS